MRESQPGEMLGMLVPSYAARDVDVTARMCSDRPTSGDHYVYRAAKCAWIPATAALVDGMWVRLQVSEVNSTIIQIKAWPDGRPEADTWQYSILDNQDPATARWNRYADVSFETGRQRAREHRRRRFRAEAVTAAPTPTIASGAPVGAVDQFYAFIGRRQLRQAIELWTPHMRVSFPPAEI